MGHVHAEAIDPAVAPEAQRALKVLTYCRVGPVQVRLLGGEDVQVPLVGAPCPRSGQGRTVLSLVLHPLPDGATEQGTPVIGRLHAVLASALVEVVEPALGGVWPTRQRSAEPGMTVGGVVRHEVDDHPDPGLMESGDHGVEVLQRPDLRGDVAVVVNVVAAVGQGGGIEGREPHGVHAEASQVGHAAGDTGKVADAVAVSVREGTRVDLVDDGVLPPLTSRGLRGLDGVGAGRCGRVGRASHGRHPARFWCSVKPGGGCARPGAQHSTTLTASPPREVSLYLASMSSPV